MSGMATDVRVECLTAMSAGASTLASRTPFMLHRWLRPDAPEMLAAMVRHRLDQAIASHGSQAWCASAGREVSAVAVLQPLPWDSNVLDTSAGRIELIAAGDYAERRAGVAAVLRSALAAATAAGMRHVSVRVDAADDAGIHELESRGFLNVDALVTFGRHVDAPVDASVSRGARVRPLAAEDRQAVGEIAADAFREGRFHADPDISPEAARRV